MSITTSEMTPADIRACTCGNDGYSGGNGMWGDGAWWIIILLLFGWGRNGFGGGYGGGSGVGENYVLATDFATIERKLDGVNNGLCDGFYAQNTNLLTGFSGISREIASCCCETNRNIDQLRFDTERQHCETRRAIDANADRIIGYLTNQEMDRLRCENQALRLNASQAAQNAYLINELRPTAKPAYITCSPFSSAFGWGSGWGNGNGCGCGCG